MKTVFKLSLLISIILFTSISNGQYPNYPVTTISEEQSETSIEVSPLDPNKLIAGWNDANNSDYVQPGFGYSTDGGKTWTRGFVNLPAGNQFGYDPSCSFDRHGNV